jgi:predicted lipoprotein with Yx(FWY)xxD motif
VRIRTAFAVLLLATASSASAAGALSGPDHARAIVRLVERDRALAERLVAVAEATGGPRFGAAAAHATGIVDPLENTDPWLGLLVPDLDGDGGPDVLDLRWSRDHAPEYTMQARRGSDGSRLWRYESDRQFSIPFVVWTAEREPGIGLFEIDYTVSATDWHYYVASFDAAGHKRFDVELTEQAYGPAGLLTATPMLHAVLPGGDGHPTELLLGLDTQTPGVHVGGVGTATHAFQVQAMSMVDATVDDRGELLTTFGFSPRIQQVGDMTGDDHHDFVVTHGTADLEERNGVVVARHSDGTDRWTREGLVVGSMSSASSAGDVTGDGLEDVMISAFGGPGGAGLYVDPGGGGLPDPLDIFGIPQDVTRTVTLIEAAEGEVRWERAGLFGQSQSDMTGDGLAESLVWDVLSTEDEVELRVAALTGVGDVVLDVSMARLAAPTPDPDQFGFGVWFVGDVDDDGVDDLMYALYAAYGDEVEEMDGLADGRTARLIRRDVPVPLYGSLDGRGNDMQEIEFDATGRSVTVTVTDGLTGDELAVLEADTTDAISYLAPVDLDLDDCNDLFLGTRIGPTFSDAYAFTFRSPEPLWALRRHDKGDTADVSAVTLTARPGLCERLAAPGDPAPDTPAPGLPPPATPLAGPTDPGPLPATGGTVATGPLAAGLLSAVLAALVALRRAASAA